jgi:hypothetical protein
MDYSLLLISKQLYGINIVKTLFVTINIEVAMKTILFAIINFTTVLTLTDCDIKDLLSDEFFGEGAYSDDYIASSPPNCEVTISCGYRTYSSHEENINMNLVITNTSTDLSAHNVKCNVSILDDGESVTTDSISFGLILPGQYKAASFMMSIHNPHKMYNDVKCIISWHDENNNYYEVVKLDRIY